MHGGAGGAGGLGGGNVGDGGGGDGDGGCGDGGREGDGGGDGDGEGGGGEDGGGVGGEGEGGGGGGISGGGDGVLLGSQSMSAGLQYKLSMSLPLHIALKTACLPVSQKLKPNNSLWKKGPLFLPQKPPSFSPKVVHRARLHLTDLPEGRDGSKVEVSEGVLCEWCRVGPTHHGMFVLGFWCTP